MLQSHRRNHNRSLTIHNWSKSTHGTTFTTRLQNGLAIRRPNLLHTRRVIRLPTSRQLLAQRPLLLQDPMQQINAVRLATQRDALRRVHARNNHISSWDLVTRQERLGLLCAHRNSHHCPGCLRERGMHTAQVRRDNGLLGRYELRCVRGRQLAGRMPDRGLRLHAPFLQEVDEGDLDCGADGLGEGDLADFACFGGLEEDFYHTMLVHSLKRGHRVRGPVRTFECPVRTLLELG